MNILILLFSVISFTVPQVKVENIWMRSANKGMNSALYFDVNNLSSKDDELTDVYSKVANTVQIHETFKEGESMGMRRVVSVIIKGKGTFHFAPGGYHIMVIKLKENLKAGDKKEFILTFKHAGKVKIIAVVRKD
jgi:copper(I)-binding protein